MSMQHHDLETILDNSIAIDLPVNKDDSVAMTRLFQLIGDLEKLVSRTRSENPSFKSDTHTVTREERIRDLRVQFGFDSDDAPRPDLSPFS